MDDFFSFFSLVCLELTFFIVVRVIMMYYFIAILYFFCFNFLRFFPPPHLRADVVVEPIKAPNDLYKRRSAPRNNRKRKEPTTTKKKTNKQTPNNRKCSPYLPCYPVDHWAGPKASVIHFCWCVGEHRTSSSSSRPTADAKRRDDTRYGSASPAGRRSSM